LTIDDVFDQTRRMLTEDIDILARNLRWARGIVAIECHQRIDHLHALI
jgi:hypothetical protein